MATKSGGNNIDYWRDYFRTANSGIFDIIEHSIMVAASDCPKEFRLKRERIAELLFSCRLTRCLGCDRVELTESRVDDDEGEEDGDDDDDDEGFKIKGREIDEHGRVGSKGSKVNSISGNDHGEIGGEMEMNNQYDPESNFSYGDAEALSDEIEEEREIVGEVLRIKEILHNGQDESDSVLFESLKRLQLMALNVDILKATEIGKAVNGIRRHNSKQIRHLARALIDGWKIIVDEWVKATQEIAEGGTPDSVNPSTVEEEEDEEEEEEEGLPSPPMDEAFLFGNQNMELSEFFDGMDDDGNPRNCGEFNKNREVGRRKPFIAKQDAPKRRQEPPKEATPLSKENNRVPQMKRQVPLPKPNRPSNTQSGPGRPVKPNGDPKLSRDSRVPQKSEKPMIQRRPAPPAERSRSSDPDAVQEKLEATKRKLQERYQQAENAKRQRTIQVMELHDLPKQGLVNKNTQAKFGNHNRNWANARR